MSDGQSVNSQFKQSIQDLEFDSVDSLLYCILISHVDKGKINYQGDLQKQENSKFLRTMKYRGVLQWLFFPCEDHMKCKGASKGCLLCMDSIIGKNFTVDTFWLSTILIANWCCCMCKNSWDSIEQHLLNFSVTGDIL